MWEQLEKNYNGEGWPRSSAYISKKYEELIVEHAMWPDRKLTLEEAYQKLAEKGVLKPEKQEL